MVRCAYIESVAPRPLAPRLWPRPEGYGYVCLLGPEEVLETLFAADEAGEPSPNGREATFAWTLVLLAIAVSCSWNLQPLLASG